MHWYTATILYKFNPSTIFTVSYATVIGQQILPTPFWMLLWLRQKWGGVFAQVFNLSWLYTATTVFQDRVHSSQSPNLQSRVSVSLKELLVECEVENIQEDFTVAILKNNMIVGNVSRERSLDTSCRRMVVRWLASSLAVGSLSESDSHMSQTLTQKVREMI